MGVHRKFVAFYYLNYLEDLKRDFGELRVVCLKRDKQETVESYMRKVPEANHWGEGPKTKWSKCYPTYDLPKKEGIAQYYDDYYTKAEEWAENDWFEIMNMRDVLNTKEGQKEAFEHLGLEFKAFQKYHKNATN